MAKSQKYQFFDIPTEHKSTVSLQNHLTLKLPADMRYISALTQMLHSLCELTDPRAAQKIYRENLTAALREGCSHLINDLQNPRLQFEVRFVLCNNRIELVIEEPWNQNSEVSQVSLKKGYALHMIQKHVDKVSYQQENGPGTLTLVKYFVMPACKLNP